MLDRRQHRAVGDLQRRHEPVRAHGIAALAVIAAQVDRPATPALDVLGSDDHATPAYLALRKAGEKIARVCCADRPAARAAAGVALSAFEPDDLIVEVAKVYSRLCFVIGCVAPNVDEQSSRFVHGGRSWGWRLSSRRKEAIWKQLVPEETDDNTDEVLWGEVQADWQMMDEVVAHWRPKMDCAMAGAALIFAHGGTLASVDSGPRDEYASPP